MANSLDSSAFDSIIDRLLNPKAKKPKVAKKNQMDPIEKFLKCQNEILPSPSNTIQDEDDLQIINYHGEYQSIDMDISTQQSLENSQLSLFNNNPISSELSKKPTYSSFNQLFKKDMISFGQQHHIFVENTKITTNIDRGINSQFVQAINYFDNQINHQKIKGKDQLSKESGIISDDQNISIDIEPILRKSIQNKYKEKMQYLKLYDDTASDKHTLYIELVFFLGSLFYPDKMKKAIDDDSEVEKIINEIDTSIHHYSFKGLCFITQWPAFKHITKDYIDNVQTSSQIENQNKICSNKENYSKCIDFLKGMIAY
ncbi:UNKNOWN [Stylonychia lemnae]|uniref:Uncharacterized protein n=1 Tax=Stylonychia lemnae TaxID=5949 RepID=A0A078AHI9_STYLE|nr:UNKNOWN [Stylonychia lemnae]|eukprot:CDW81750.1 UNKNOWN [Stylonychia lemnae]